MQIMRNDTNQCVQVRKNNVWEALRQLQRAKVVTCHLSAGGGCAKGFWNLKDRVTIAK
jgi:hypothetical protein